LTSILAVTVAVSNCHCEIPHPGPGPNPLGRKVRLGYIAILDKRGTWNGDMRQGPFSAMMDVGSPASAPYTNLRGSGVSRLELTWSSRIFVASALASDFADGGLNPG